MLNAVVVCGIQVCVLVCDRNSTEVYDGRLWLLTIDYGYGSRGSKETERIALPFPQFLKLLLLLLLLGVWGNLSNE